MCLIKKQASCLPQYSVSFYLFFSCIVLLFAEDKLVLRLSDSKTNTGAVVEVFDGVGSWGTVCTHTWSLAEAQVVCGYAGYQRALGAIRFSTTDPSKSKLTSFECVFQENSFERCFDGFIPEECACETVDAGVICSNGTDMITVFYMNVAISVT